MDEISPELGINQKDVLATVGDVKIVRPSTSAMPVSEGNHLQVTTREEIPWTQRPAKEIVRMGLFALPTAKVVAEGRFTEELWANIHLNSYPDFDYGVNVYGRNPTSETGWAKPVAIRETLGEEIPSEEKQKLERTFAHYLPMWQRLGDNLELFSDGVGELSPESESFEKERAKNAEKNEKMIWANERFSLVVVGRPHLSGLHLVAHPRDDYWAERGGFRRPWQIDPNQPDFQEHVQGFLEAMSIILGAERVLIEEGKLPFYNPEIHFSGNWTPDFQPPERGGTLDTSYLSQADLEKARKEEKREHRVGGAEEWNSSMHGHLYATRDPNTYVSLPTRPEKEVPEQWAGITPLTDDEEGAIKTLISERLTPWLEENARGGLNP